jgi:hypothetical protein
VEARNFQDPVRTGAFGVRIVTGESDFRSVEDETWLEKLDEGIGLRIDNIDRLVVAVGQEVRLARSVDPRDIERG